LGLQNFCKVEKLFRLACKTFARPNYFSGKLAKLLQVLNIFQMGLQNFCKGEIFFGQVCKNFARVRNFSGRLAKLLQGQNIFNAHLQNFCKGIILLVKGISALKMDEMDFIQWNMRLTRY
jgi:hypothetical protein